jgi:hypothetical protein
MVSSFSEVPADVRAALKDLCKGCTFADMGADWNPTDVIDNRPTRRIKQAGYSETEWFVQYEHGGYAPHSHMVVFALAPSVHFTGGSTFTRFEPTGHSHRTCEQSEGSQCEW